MLNDAVAALIAEATSGAAKNKQHVVMLTLWHGSGGAILIDGKPYQGAFNKAGHFGHMVIDENGDRDVTGIPGSLEDCIGNCTIEKEVTAGFLPRMICSSHSVTETHLQEKIWLRSVRQLAIGIASITNILSPQVIVLGGGIAEAGSVFV